VRRRAQLGARVRAIRPGALLDRLLRGRAWVALTAVLLVGIVFLNVNLLELNGSIARMDTRAAELKRENAALRMRIARLGSSERIQAAAAGLGFVPAEPGRVGYLTASGANAARAARALEAWRAPRPPGQAAPGQGAGAGPP
jgi:cell division protein FtsL